MTNKTELIERLKEDAKTFFEIESNYEQYLNTLDSIKTIEQLRSEVESLKKVPVFDHATHKIVPINPTYEMVTAWHDSVFNYEDDDENVAKSISNVIAAAPEYQESEQIPVAIGEVQHYAAPANLPAYVNAKGYGNPPKNGAKVYALPPTPEGGDHIDDANKMVKTAHVCAFSRSIIDGETETCICGAWR